ncbi:MAG: LptF/LptG family permease [Flavisolibacter sp.]|nr:LptF/LptG family permease [Flavisolibacter sp.]MBD0350994.1 LptF/LptG family permease [Flavisolibacter sp.]MBD0366476.1 LptF/LptG family permease [Flavisolibacter sp.]
MKKLDWYILKQFFVTFIFCMLLFTIIAVAVDSSENAARFVRTGLSTTDIIKKYYTGFVPFIWGLLYPLFVFIAVIFFTSRLALRSEVIAILASGTTYNRWLRPYVIGGIVFAIVLWFANAYLIPKANVIRNDFQRIYIDKDDPLKNMSTSSFYMRSDSNTYVGIRYFDTSSKIATSFFLDRVRNNKVYYNLRAERMQWDTLKKDWKLTNAVERRLDTLGETIRIIPELHLSLNFSPQDLRKDEYLKDNLTAPQLATYIRMEELRGTEGLNALKVEWYRRTATPFTCLLLTLIGAIIAGRKTRGGSGLHLSIGFIIAALFIISDRFSTVFSVKGNLPPLVAAWLPNIVFTIVAYYLYRKAPK